MFGIVLNVLPSVLRYTPRAPLLGAKAVDHHLVPYPLHPTLVTSRLLLSAHIGSNPSPLSSAIDTTGAAGKTDLLHGGTRYDLD